MNLLHVSVVYSGQVCTAVLNWSKLLEFNFLFLCPVLLCVDEIDRPRQRIDGHCRQAETAVLLPQDVFGGTLNLTQPTMQPLDRSTEHLYTHFWRSVGRHKKQRKKPRRWCGRWYKSLDWQDVVECRTIARDRKSWSKLMCHSVVFNLQQWSWKNDSDGCCISCECVDQESCPYVHRYGLCDGNRPRGTCSGLIIFMRTVLVWYNSVWSYTIYW